MTLDQECIRPLGSPFCEWPFCERCERAAERRMRRQIVLDPNTKMVRLGGRLQRPIGQILAVQLGLFLLYAFTNGPALIRDHLFVAGSSAIVRFEIWQPFTALWFHVGTRSLLLNSVALWMLGIPLIRWWGRRRFFFYWLITGLAGLVLAAFLGLAWPDYWVAGSGGASMALLLAVAVLFPKHLIFFYGVLPLQARWVCSAIGAFVIIGTIVDGAMLDFVVQLGGLGSGVVFLFPPKQVLAKRRRKRVLKQMGVVDGGRTRDDGLVN